MFRGNLPNARLWDDGRLLAMIIKTTGYKWVNLKCKSQLAKSLS